MFSSLVSEEHVCFDKQKCLISVSQLRNINFFSLLGITKFLIDFFLKFHSIVVISIFCFEFKGEGQELSSLRVGYVSGTFNITASDEPVTIKPPLRMHISIYEFGLDGVIPRTATGFIDLESPQIRKDYIYHFAKVEIKDDVAIWGGIAGEIESFEATNAKIRLLRVYFDPHPDSWNNLVLIDEIELFKRDCKNPL
jgi:hypothetical protein